ncbi:MAG: Rieske 2Fe-2S domain-containing protein [Caulobacter sp.]|nr:Rieske 2Fe-2S domain-containing protein [Caulobacter sp.]
MTTITAAELGGMIDERPDDGVFRVHRRMFTDEQIFELEMKHIFEGSWVYVAHESQIPNPNDFLTAHLGRQPIILTRTRDEGLKALLNACAHRGATLELAKCGNKKLFVCPFHGWSFENTGKVISCGENETSGYGSGFKKEDHDLTLAPKVASYRGFIFASLNPDVPELEEYLGASRTFIDLIVDQDPNGEIEVLPGSHSYTYDGNWKLQAENGVDGYHVNMIHGNYVMTVDNRQRIANGRKVVEAVDVGNFSKYAGGYYAFENGHVVLWNESPNPQIRPAYASRARYVEEFGEDRAKWMTDCWRNLFLYPNLFLMDQMSSQIRMFRPLAVDKTLVTAVCFAPKSDTPERRATRLRQYEDFFNASGMATPDDLAAFNATQQGYKARKAEWSDVSRGSKNLIKGDDERARRLGFTPQYGGSGLQDEGIYLNQHHKWLSLLSDALAKPAAQTAER